MNKKNAPFFQNLTKRRENFIERAPSIEISFNRGAKVSMQGYTKKEYIVEFWNTETGILEFRTSIKGGFFAAPNKRYVVKWNIKIFENGALIKSETVDFKGKTVHVFLESSSLGDNLAWMPQALKFAEMNDCKLVLTTFYNDFFKEKYPEITFNDPGSSLPPHDYSYAIGYFYDENLYNGTPVDPRTSPLGKVACDILNIPYEEIRPELDFLAGENPLPETPYVCIATHSTAGAKFWHREGGWQQVVDYLREKGFEVAVIQKEPTDLNNVLDWTGESPLKERMNQLHHAKFFIGIGSGLSWLAWAMKKKVIMISGFSDPFAEFQLDCERIINRKVCNSCWNDTSFQFDKGDWWWCPRLKGTERHFECSKQISAEEVFERIEKILA